MQCVDLGGRRIIKKLGSFMDNIDEIRKQNLNGIAEKFDWSIMAEEYDVEFSSF